MTRTPAPALNRSALAPAILAAIALVVGLWLLESDAYLIVRFVVAILAAITSIFVVQSRQWWWLAVTVPVVVVWNPVIVLDWGGQLWVASHYAAALLLVIVGVRTRVPESSK